MIIPQRIVNDLRTNPWFREWLHGGDPNGPIRVPVPTDVEIDPYGETVLGMTYDTAVIDLRKFSRPAPWAVREYRYLSYVAMSGDQVIDESESWRWFRNPEFVDPELPPNERRER